MVVAPPQVEPLAMERLKSPPLEMLKLLHPWNPDAVVPLSAVSVTEVWSCSFVLSRALENAGLSLLIQVPLLLLNKVSFAVDESSTLVVLARL